MISIEIIAHKKIKIQCIYTNNINFLKNINLLYTEIRAASLAGDLGRAGILCPDAWERGERQGKILFGQIRTRLEKMDHK